MASLFLYLQSDAVFCIITGRRLLFIILLPSINKGKHACQRAFAALFALLTLAGVSPPADQKPKIARKSIAGRWEAVLPRRNVSRQGKTRREYLLYFQGA